MPADRFLHPRLGRDVRVSQLTDLEARVWSQGYLLCADDFGVMRCSALPIQELNDPLAKRPGRVIERYLARLVDIGLLMKFEYQERLYVCSSCWQEEQKVRYPRDTLNPVPPADILARCSEETREVFRLHCDRRPATLPEDSGSVSETLPEDSGNVSETFLTPARAGGREVANGYRLQARGKRLQAANANSDGLRERFDTFWAVRCRPALLPGTPRGVLADLFRVDPGHALDVRRDGSHARECNPNFKEPRTKGLVLKAVTSKVIAAVVGSPEMDRWAGHAINLYRTEATFGDQVYDVVRVRRPSATIPARPADLDTPIPTAAPAADEHPVVLDDKGQPIPF